MEIAIGTLIGLILFIIPMWSYRLGLKDGLKIKEGKPIEQIKKPFKMPFKEPKKEDDLMMQGLQNIFSYDGTEQKVKEDE